MPAQAGNNGPTTPVGATRPVPPLQPATDSPLTGVPLGPFTNFVGGAAIEIGQGLLDVGAVTLTASKQTLDLRPSITDVEIVYDMMAASTITIQLKDPTRAILRSPLLQVGLPSDAKILQALAAAKASNLTDEKAGLTGSSAIGAPNTAGSKNTAAAAEKNIPAAGSPPANTGAIAERNIPPAATAKTPPTSGPIAGLTQEQSNNARAIVSVAKSLGLSSYGALIGIATAMGESSLMMLNYGDAAGPDSRGLFQQRDSWGTLAQRMDPVTSAKLFFNALVAVPGWEKMTVTVAAHTVQRNADPTYYTQFVSQATQIVNAIGYGSAPLIDLSGTPNGTGGVAPSGSAAPPPPPPLGQDLVQTGQTATVTYRKQVFALTAVATQDDTVTLTFEDENIQKLRNNHQEVAQQTNMTISDFAKMLLTADKIDTKHVQGDEVRVRNDPTDILDAGESDPASLKEFDKLLELDQRGPGETSTPRIKAANGGATASSWDTITSVISELNWRAFALEGTSDIVVGSDLYAIGVVNHPTLSLKELTNGIGWFNGSFDLSSKTSNTLTFTTTEPFPGHLAQRVEVTDMGLLSGAWMVSSYSFRIFSAKTSVTLKRIEADRVESTLADQDLSIAAAQAAAANDPVPSAVNDATGTSAGATAGSAGGTGGPLKDPGGIGTGGIGTLSWPNIKRVAAANGWNFTAQFEGDVGAGTPGSQSFHETGNAVDFSGGADMGAFAQWVYDHFGKWTLELIHAPFNHNLKDGNDYGDGFAFYGAGTMNQHYNHVHWAITNDQLRAALAAAK